MGLMPCLRRGSDRWWLPCSLQVTEVLGELLLRTEPGQPLTAASRRRAHRAILTDPPLMIYASLGWTGDRVEPMQLVDWLADHIVSRLASGDAYLGEPPITSAVAKRWNRLRDHFRTLPIQRWLEDAALWLEVMGPTVPAAWKQQWPAVQLDEELPAQIDASQPLDDPGPPFHLLQQLARTVQHQRSLESAFDRRLHKNKLGALKQLAYGLSHEINNPLANISTRAQQLQRGEEDPSRAATLQRIVDQVYRAHEMIADLMFYANPPAARFLRVDSGSVAVQHRRRLSRRSEATGDSLGTQSGRKPTRDGSRSTDDWRGGRCLDPQCHRGNRMPRDDCGFAGGPPEPMGDPRRRQWARDFGKGPRARV